MNDKLNGLLQLNKEKRGGLFFSLLICLNCVISFLGQSIFVVLFGAETFAYSVSRFALPVISIVITLCVSGISEKNKPFDFGKGERLSVCVILAILIAVGGFCAFGFVNGVIAEGLTAIGLKVASSELTINGAGEYIFLIVFAAILPAITEETFFRGVLIKSFSEAGTVFSVLFSACLFSVYHCSATQLVYQFIFGVCFGIVYVKSKSVLPSMIAHFLNNAAVLSFEYFGVVVPYKSVALILSGAIVFVVSLAIILFAVKSNRPGEDSAQNSVTGKKSHAVVYASFGIFICLLSVIAGLFI